MQELKTNVPVTTPFVVKSLHGNSPVREKYRIKFFGTSTDFCILPNITTFDGIIGHDLLNQVNAEIDFVKGIINHNFGTEKL